MVSAFQRPTMARIEATLCENDCNNQGKCRQLWETAHECITHPDRESGWPLRKGGRIWHLAWVWLISGNKSARWESRRRLYQAHNLITPEKSGNIWEHCRKWKCNKLHRTSVHRDRVTSNGARNLTWDRKYRPFCSSPRRLSLSSRQLGAVQEC